MGLEVDHLPPSSAEVKIKVELISSPLMCLHVAEKTKFTSILPFTLRA